MKRIVCSLSIIIFITQWSLCAAEKQALAGKQFDEQVQAVELEEAGPQRLHRARDMISRHYLSSQQVKAIAMRLPDDMARLEFATDAYLRTIDRDNFYEVYDAFTSFSKVMRLHDRVRELRRSAPMPPPGSWGPQPVTPDDFKSMLRTLRNEPFDPNRIQLARQILKSSQANFLSSQIKELLGCFSFEPGKMEVAKFAYDYVIDPEKYYVVYDAFSFSNSRTDLSKYIESKGRRNN